jgi:hypothetical protein
MQVMTRLLHAVYDELASVQPDGLRYATVQLEDKVTLVSFVQLEDGPDITAAQGVPELPDKPRREVRRAATSCAARLSPP